jgi:hypothetical protein
MSKILDEQSISKHIHKQFKEAFKHTEAYFEQSRTDLQQQVQYE